MAMCRVYHTNKGDFVRLCYRFGHRKGLKIPFKGEPPIGPSGHYTGLSQRASSGKRLPPRRCAICGGPVSRHDTICELCRRQKGEGEGDSTREGLSQ